MKIQILDSHIEIDTLEDELLETFENGVERRKTTAGLVYDIQQDKRDAHKFFVENGRRAGRVKSPARAKASAMNGKLYGGRPAKLQDGIARAALRKAIGEALDINNLAPDVSRLLYANASARVLRRTWPLAAGWFREPDRGNIARLVEELAVAVETKKGARNITSSQQSPQTVRQQTQMPTPVWGGAWGGKA